MTVVGLSVHVVPNVYWLTVVSPVSDGVVAEIGLRRVDRCLHPRIFAPDLRLRRGVVVHLEIVVVAVELARRVLHVVSGRRGAADVGAGAAREIRARVERLDLPGDVTDAGLPG